METEWKPKPWLAILLGLLLQPMTFLYLQKVKLFWLYFITRVSAVFFDWYFHTSSALIFVLICPVHAFLIAKNISPVVARKWYSRWWGIPSIYAAIIVPIFIIRSFFYEPFLMPSASMAPTVNIGDHILVKKQGYGNYGSFGITLKDGALSSEISVSRGKIYAFYPPHKDGVIYIKRLIGMPGDSIDITEKNISINGELLTTKLVALQASASIYQESNSETTYKIRRSRAEQKTLNLVVPKDSYFFLGDNRDNSADSRYWGPVPEDRFIGEVFYVLKK